LHLPCRLAAALRPSLRQMQWPGQLALHVFEVCNRLKQRGLL
jgi:hypothetical protein